MTQAAFGQRRKMLRQSLKSLAAGDVSALLARRRHRADGARGGNRRRRFRRARADARRGISASAGRLSPAGCLAAPARFDPEAREIVLAVDPSGDVSAGAAAISIRDGDIAGDRRFAAVDAVAEADGRRSRGRARRRDRRDRRLRSPARGSRTSPFTLTSTVTSSAPISPTPGAIRSGFTSVRRDQRIASWRRRR